MKTLQNKFVLITIALLSFAYAGGSVAQDVPAGSKVLMPSELKWSESPRAPGVQTAPLVGDPTKPGLYVFRAKYPPNTVNRPHHHPADEEITVLSGTFYFGDGLTMEPEKTLTLPAGSYIAVPAKTWHFLFTKSETVEVEIRGIGPRANIFAK
ncbi:MAG TPA: cupin domain-containing protein [Candidatus Binatia bacterium]|jgi:quercetin dioxygenase-like cupin family protein